MLGKLFTAFVLIGTGVMIGWQLSLTPSHERNWQEHYARTPDAEVMDSVVRLRNVRNWSHDESGVTGRVWLDEVEIDPTEIVQVWFALSALSGSASIGHSFLSFELADGQAYTFSIEARREEGEDYSVLLGMLRQYELWYGWGTEQDFFGVSLILLERPLELYPLDLTAEQRARLFVAAARATHEVAEQPRFYNTLTANCTNLLAKAINAQAPGTIPYHPAWNLPGFAPAFLARQGFIADTDIATLRERHRFAQASPAIRSAVREHADNFSVVLRSELQTQVSAAEL